MNKKSFKITCGKKNRIAWDKKLNSGLKNTKKPTFIPLE